MIELVDNGIQLILTCISAIIALSKAIATRKREWLLTGLFSGVFFLGSLYWTLFLVFYQQTPLYSYIPYLAWYTSYLILILLLVQIKKEWKKTVPYRVLWLVPVFTVGFFLFFIQRGDYLGNVISTILMTFVLWHSLTGLLSLRGKTGTEAKSRGIYLVALFFCLTEYALWTASWFWIGGDTIRNPYYWLDIILSLYFILILPAVGKEVA